MEEANEYIKDWIKEEYGVDNPSQAMIEDVFNEIDSNHDNLISKEELETHMRETKEARMMDTPT